MRDVPLTRAVEEELLWDPRIDSDKIAAGADAEGVVTLRGTVPSFRQKRVAAEATAGLAGVTRVVNELEVRILDAHRRLDSSLRADVLQALMLDSLVPDTVDADVRDGVVTLTGSATWQYERDEAETVTMNVLGVTGMKDEIVLDGPRPDAFAIKDAIKRAFGRAAVLDAENLVVETINDGVTLSGTVKSMAEHDAALRVAWAAPGVRSVQDQIVVAATA
jgi:osmotically-inducible protein OsmY